MLLGSIILLQFFFLSPCFGIDKCPSAFLESHTSFYEYLPIDRNDLQAAALQSEYETPGIVSGNLAYSRASLAFISELQLVGLDKSPLNRDEETVLQDWINDDFYRDVQVTNSIRLSYGSETIQTDCCDLADRFHEETLIRQDSLTEDFGKTTYIELENLGIVGAVKRIGDPSFVALLNLVDSDGRPVLIKGALYDIDKSVLHDLLSPIRKSDRKFIRVKLSKLILRPRRFLNASRYFYASLPGLKETNSIASARPRHRALWKQFLKHVHPPQKD